MPEKLIKSKERVKKNAEVFTPAWMVKDMLDNIKKECGDDYIKGSYFEPSFGTGNFLVEILTCKIASGIDPISALKKMYGVELLPDNVCECKARLKNIAMAWYEKQIEMVMDTNLLQGNFLTDQDTLVFKDWDTGETQSLTDIKKEQLKNKGEQ